MFFNSAPTFCAFAAATLAAPGTEHALGVVSGPPTARPPRQDITKPVSPRSTTGCPDTSNVELIPLKHARRSRS